MMRHQFALAGLTVAVMFLGAPMAANAVILQADYFTEDTLGDTNWENTWGTPLTLDTGNKQLDWNFVNADDDSDAAWDLTPSSSGTGDGDTWTISFDVQFGQRVAAMEIAVMQKGHSLVVGAASSAGFSIREATRIR